MFNQISSFFNFRAKRELDSVFLPPGKKATTDQPFGKPARAIEPRATSGLSISPVKVFFIRIFNPSYGLEENSAALPRASRPVSFSTKIDLIVFSIRLKLANTAADLATLRKDIQAFAVDHASVEGKLREIIQSTETKLSSLNRLE